MAEGVTPEAPQLCKLCRKHATTSLLAQCAACREKNRRRYARSKKMGICVQCTQPKAPGHVLCLRHLEKAQHSYWQKVVHKVCKNCRGALDQNRSLCLSCTGQLLAKKRQRYQTRKAQGLCVRCGKAPQLFDHTLCEKHYKARKLYHQRIVKRRHIAAHAQAPTTSHLRTVRAHKQVVPEQASEARSLRTVRAHKQVVPEQASGERDRRLACYAYRRAHQLCVKCGDPALPAHTACARCRERQNRLAAQRRTRTVRKRSNIV